MTASHKSLDLMRKYYQADGLSVFLDFLENNFCDRLFTTIFSLSLMHRQRI